MAIEKLNFTGAGADQGSSSSSSLQSYWVQQRDFYLIGLSSNPNEISPSMLFTNLNTVNNPFASDMEDNFFILV